METLISISFIEKENTFVFEGELDETNVDKTMGNIEKQIKENVTETTYFNFKGLKYLNSKTIGYIAEIQSLLEDAGGELIIIETPDTVLDILSMVGLTSIMKIK